MNQFSSESSGTVADPGSESNSYAQGFVEAILFVEGVRSPSAEDWRRAVQTLAVFRAFARLKKYGGTGSLADGATFLQAAG